MSLNNHNVKILNLGKAIKMQAIESLSIIFSD